MDESEDAIAFANVLLLKPSDSSFIKGTSATELGDFIFEGVSAKKYLIQASYIGRNSQIFAFDVQGDVVLDDLIIDLTAEQLDEVVVAAAQPKIERLQDRLVFDVENTTVAQGDSWDILRNTPGVIVSGNNLQIRGSAATIYLNNRRVQLSGEELKTLLESFSGTNVKSVEVIPNPPANFDAEGGPVLNIITSKAITPGYKGSVNANWTQSVFPKYNFGTSHYFKTEKLDVFANYNLSPRKELRKTRKGINFRDDNNDIFSIWDTNIEEVKRKTLHNATAIVDYSIDDRNSLNLTTTFVSNPNETMNSNLATQISNNAGVLDSTFVTASDMESSNTNFAMDLSYAHDLKKPGSRITFNGHYTDFGQNFTQGIASTYFEPDGNTLRNFAFDTDSKQDIKIYTGQLDFVNPLGSGTFETGVKTSVIDSESSIDYLNFLGSDESVDSALSDNFLYDETVFAGYLSLIQSWEKWSLKLGLRGEYTDATGNSLSLGTINRQEFFELFPSAYFLYSLSDKHSFALEYRRGLGRPKYGDLNPFRTFFNENDFEEGNARLIPYFSNNFNFNYTFNSELFFDFYYRDNGEYINYLVFQDNTNLTLNELKQNVLASTSYGFDITWNKAILNPWYVYAYVSIFHEDETFLAEKSVENDFKNVVNGVYTYWANYLTLSKDGTFNGEVALTYTSNFLFGSYVSSEEIELNLGLRKSLWNNRAVISLRVEDILERKIPTYTSRYFNQDNFYRRRPEAQFVRLGFTYNFGNFRLSDNERAIDKKERDRLNNN